MISGANNIINLGAKHWCSVANRAFDQDLFSNPEFNVQIQHSIEDLTQLVSIHLRETIASDNLASISYPATWIDAIKDALMRRAPKLFGWLTPDYVTYEATAYYSKVKMPEHCSQIAFIKKEKLYV